MSYHTIPYEKRIKENIRNYTLSNLFDIEMVKEYLEKLAQLLEINILLTDRHGEKEIVIGDSFLGFYPDVVEEPGRKIKVLNRTIGHLYIKELDTGRDTKLMNDTMDGMIQLLSKLGEEVYLRREGSIYLEEVEKLLADKRRQRSQNEREDILTGVLNKNYFEARMHVIERAEIVPVAVLNININDWKFVNDHFGDEESDRLIRVVADIIKQEMKSEYVVGRIDGDVFGVLIPLVQDDEAEVFAERIQQECMAYEDAVLAPSVAVGIVYRTNIEETLEDKLSDAEYEMFNHKFEVKNAPGYRERLQGKLL